MIEDIQRLQSTVNQIRESSAAQVRLLEEQLESKQKVISRLEAVLDAQRDYDELKREIAVLKSGSIEESSINCGEINEASKEKSSGNYYYF